MKKTLLIAVLFVLAQAAAASGGKERKQNPVLVDEGECAVIVPENIDLENCELLPGTDQSGQIMLCETLVVCGDED